MTATSKPSRPDYTVKVAETSDEIEACYDLRVEVFVVEQGFSLEEERDEYDSGAVHILLTTPISSPPPEASLAITPTIQNIVSTIIPESITSSTERGDRLSKSKVTQRPIGTIRYYPPLGKLSRLVVSKEYRQYGFGKILVEKLDEVALKLGKEGIGVIEDGKVVVKCHSQLQVIPFYQRLGYEPQGEQFDEDGAPHQKMVKSLSFSSVP